MAKKIVLAAAVLAAVGTGFLVWPRPAPRPAETAAVVGPTAESTAEDPTALSRTPVLDAESAAAESSPAPAALDGLDAEDDTRPPLVPPFTVHLRIVDGAGQPVPGAHVDVRESRAPGRGFRDFQFGTAERQFLRPAPDAVQCASARSDDEGRCSVRLERAACHAAVSRPGIGCALRQLSVSDAARDEVIVKLVPWVSVAGSAVHAGGRAAAGAVVRAAPIEFAPVSEPASADADGRFRLELSGASCRLQARQGAAESHALALHRPYDGDTPVLLRFPGALVVRGFLLDPAGRPCTGTVWAKGIVQRRAVYSRADADDSGAFTLDVPEAAVWELIGTATGQAHSEPVRAEVSDAQPAAEVLLRLFASTGVRGVVVREDGTSIAGARVTLLAQPMAGVRSPQELVRYYGAVDPVASRDDGAFVLAGVHPTPWWTLTCTPDPGRPLVVVEQKDVRGGQELRIVVASDALRTATVAGRVVDERGGPVTDFEVRVATPDTESRSERAVRDVMHLRVRDAEGRFRVEGLPFGSTFTLFFDAAGFPQGVVGPWTVDAAERREIVRLERSGALRVRIVDAAGQPVRSGCRLQSEDPRMRFQMLLGSDAEGVVHVPKLLPMRYKVAPPGAVRGQWDDAAEVEVTVLAGSTAEVELRLPRR